MNELFPEIDKNLQTNDPLTNFVLPQSYKKNVMLNFVKLSNYVFDQMVEKDKMSGALYHSSMNHRNRIGLGANKNYYVLELNPYNRKQYDLITEKNCGGSKSPD